MIAIIDYGVGNLFSLQSSLRYLGLDSGIVSDPEALDRYPNIILPGVGAFRDAMEKLRHTGMEQAVHSQAKAGKPLLGICLGMQMLFDESLEYGRHRGLGLVSGKVRSIADDLSEPLKVPHIGWNSLRFLKKSPLLRYIREGDYVYYVHSYYAKECEDSLIAVSDYGVTVAGVVQSGNVFGTQFHPEKSGGVGLRILKAFSEIKGGNR